MNIVCLHGYFFFREDALGEVAQFNSYFGKDLVSVSDYYTFSALADAPIYCVSPKTYLGMTTVKTFCGNPWDIMRENGLVYNFSLDKVVPISSVSGVASYYRTRTGYSSKGLIQPGFSTPNWQIITGFNGGFDFSTLNFYYSELFGD